MVRIAVKTAGSVYDVVVERGSLERAAEYMRAVIGERRLFVAADPGAWRAQGARIEAGLRGLDYTVLKMEGGEENKRLRQVEALAEQMYAAGADRKCCVLAFGGGIAGDVGGFLAASYMRGVDVIQIPTTLLAQVDAAIGGKTGVNLASGKNLVGAFHQPKLVLIDPSTLSTLPEREYRAGLYEVVKAGVIWSRSLFDVMALEREAVLARQPETLESIIAESVRIKAEVVSKDEREAGLRRILNYGHTLGHALEAETGYKLLLHGEAVAFGMIAAGCLAEGARLLTLGDRETIERTVLAYGPIPSLNGISASRLVERLRGDKKTIAGQVHFVLADRIGHVKVLSGLDSSLIEQAAAAALQLCSEAAPRPAERQSVMP
jgi:3-dehydroquinate synthase